MFIARRHDVNLISLSTDWPYHFVLNPLILAYRWIGHSYFTDIATLALVHFATEYCFPVWCCSAHTLFLTSPLMTRHPLCTVTRCLRFTPMDNFFMLAGIQPTELCHQKAILSLACYAQEPEHLLYERLLFLFHGQLWQLKSRHPLIPSVLELLNNPTQSCTGVPQWTEY